MAPPLPENEIERLKVLREYDILDTAPEQAYTDLAVLAAAICQTPIAAITLVDADRSWFKALVGMDGTESPRDVAFCAHTILEQTVLVVPDATVDERFRDNPFVTEAPSVRFYAGTPLITPEGVALGSLCVIDQTPRELTPAQSEALQALGRQVVSQLQLRRQVAAQQKMEQAKDTLEGWSQSITQSANDAIVCADSTGIILSWNRAAETIFGYTEAEAIGQSLTLLMPATFHKAHQAGLERYLRTGEAHVIGKTVELSGRHKSGREFPIDLSLSSWQTARQTYFTGILRDVSDRKDVEASLAREQEFTHAVLENVADGIVACNAEGTLTLFNRATREFHGLPAAAISAEQWADHFDLYHADGQTLMQLEDIPLFRALQEQPVRGVEMVIAPKGGQRRTLLADGQALFNTEGVKLGAVVVMHDITQQKQALETQQRLTAILDATPDFVSMADAAGKTVYWNAGSKRMLGIPAEEDLVGTDLRAVHPAWTRELLRNEAFPTAIRDGSWSGETTFLRRDGSEVLTSQVIIAHLGQGGTPHHFSTIARDMTEQKQVERQIRDYTMVLEFQKAELEAQTRELEAARDQALASTRAKSEFLANMSHEIRTPMNGVLGMTGLLLETPLSDEQRDCAQTIRQSADALLTVINDILDFSKIESGKMTVEAIPFDLRSMMLEVADLLRPRADSKGIALICEFPAEFPAFFQGDSGRLRQVLVNLVGNAVKFTAQGEVRLSVCLQEDRGSETLLSLRVQDTGIGISEARQEVIFESFTQADGSHTREYGGTGLGLTISRHLVELMGGRLHVRSEPGRGSLFTVSLLLPKAADAPLSVIALPVEHTPLGLRVLLAEDHPTNRKLARRLLQKWGCDVDIAENGLEARDSVARASAANIPYDAVLMDVQMPGMDGLAATVAIRCAEQDTQSHVPIIAMTAHAMPEDKIECFAAGMDSYLSKPIKPAELYALLQKCCSRS